MTVSTLNVYDQFIPDGVGFEFDFTFRCDDETWVAALLDNVEVAGFTVDLNVDQVASPGGTVTFSIPPVGDLLVILRATDLRQSTEYNAYGRFPAASHEAAMDKLTQAVQDFADVAVRTVQYPIGTLPEEQVQQFPLYEADSVWAWHPTEPGVVVNIVNPSIAAAASAAAAAVSAAAALASETAAGISETNAAASETAAGISETNAAASEVAAGLSEVAAGVSETNAAASAAAALASEGNASTSETNAAASESAASASEINAAASEVAAAVSESAAAASYDSFDDRYLGPKAADPALDNDGDALLVGALYYNTVSSEMRVYDGSIWVAAYVPSSLYLAAPIGTLVHSYANPNPARFLACDGSAISKSTYATLFGYIGNRYLAVTQLLNTSVTLANNSVTSAYSATATIFGHATAGKVWRHDGTSFTEVTITSGAASYPLLGYDGTNFLAWYYNGGSPRVAISTDDGVSFTEQASTGGPALANLYDGNLVGNGTVWVMTRYGFSDVYYSTNNGVTWSAGTLPAPAYGGTGYTGNVIWTGTYFVTVSRSGSISPIPYGLYRSTDGNSWTEYEIPYSAYRGTGASASPPVLGWDGTTLACFHNGYVALSADEGATWTWSTELSTLAPRNVPKKIDDIWFALTLSSGPVGLQSDAVICSDTMYGGYARMRILDAEAALIPGIPGTAMATLGRWCPVPGNRFLIPYGTNISLTMEPVADLSTDFNLPTQYQLGLLPDIGTNTYIAAL